MAERPDYNPAYERGGVATDGNQPNGVSEADKEKNDGWSHRRNCSFGDDIQRGVTREVNERRHGKAHYHIEDDDDDDPPNQDSREERLPSEVYEFEETMKVAARCREKYAKHWSDATREAARWNFNERRQKLRELCDKHNVEPTIL
jgi:hypothetical protein